MASSSVLIGLRERLIAEALDLVLVEAGFDVTRCPCGPELVMRARDEAVEIVVVDPDVFAPDGTSPVLQGIAAEIPSARVVLLLRDEDDGIAHAALRQGVSGVIPAGVGTAECVSVLRQVLDGRVVYPGWVLKRRAEPVPELLSERQREVLGHLALGRSNDEIARRLFISQNTVKFHLREIYLRLGVRNRVEAARAALDILAATPPMDQPRTP